MQNPQKTNTRRIVRDAFIDMTLYMECLFMLHGVNDLLAEEIVRCIEEGYARAMKDLKQSVVSRPRAKRETAVNRFLRKLERDKN